MILVEKHLGFKNAMDFVDAHFVVFFYKLPLTGGEKDPKKVWLLYNVENWVVVCLGI